MMNSPLQLPTVLVVFWIRIRIRYFLDLQDPDPSIIKQNSKKNFGFLLFCDL